VRIYNLHLHLADADAMTCSACRCHTSSGLPAAQPTFWGGLCDHRLVADAAHAPALARLLSSVARS
jgi:hypothetical protein